MNIFLDIETIPSPCPWVREYIASTVTHPGQMKKPETIAKWVAEEKEAAIDEAMGKCSFDGALNNIICVGVATDNLPVQTFYARDHETGEINMLSALWEHLGVVKPGLNVRFIGHNIAGFDLRILKQRSMVLGVKPPVWIPFDAKPWESNLVYDTMIQWDSQNKAKLDKLAKAFAIEGKSMDGSMVHQMWLDGKHSEIEQYCASDVELVRKVYKRMTYGS